MTRLFAAGIVALGSLGAFDEIATNHDGSVLFVRTGNWIRDQPRPDNYRGGVFRMEMGGPVRPAGFITLGPAVPTPPRFDNLQVSAAGDTWLYTSNSPCLGGSSCFVIRDSNFTRLHSGGDIAFFPGVAHMSPSGRYVANYFVGSPMAGTSDSRELFDRRTGQRTRFDGLPAPGGQAVSDRGHVLLTRGDRLYRWSPDGEEAAPEWPLSQQLARISPDGERVVHQANRALWLWTPKDGSVTILPFRASFLRISGDGEWAFGTRPESGVMLVTAMRLDGSNEERNIAALPASASHVAVSGNGQVVYAALNGGTETIRVDVATGETTTEVPITPSHAPFPARPGSAADIRGTIAASSPSDVRVRVGGVDAPVLSVDRTRIRIQVPWELPVAPSVVEVLYRDPPATPWMLPPDPVVQPVAFGPVFEWESGGFFAPGGLFTPLYVHDAAARLVSVRAIGLGPVSERVATGATSPADPTALVTTPFTCTLDRQPVDIRFAGLEPGLTGIYVIAFRLPATPGPEPSLGCGMERGFQQTRIRVPPELR